MPDASALTFAIGSVSLVRGGVVLMRQWRILAILATLALTIPAVVFMPTLAAAAPKSNCGTSQNQQTGYSTLYWTGSQPRQYEGASATITDRSGYVLCTSDPNPGTNFITVWPMVFAHQPSAGYAQSGNMYRFGYNTCVSIGQSRSLVRVLGLITTCRDAPRVGRPIDTGSRPSTPARSGQYAAT